MKRSTKRKRTLATLDDQSLPLFMREHGQRVKAQVGKVLRELEALQDAQEELLRRWREFVLSRPVRRETPP